VKIVDVATQLIEQAGEPIQIEFTGLRDGEKLHEELFGEAEPQFVRPRHPLVSHVPVPPLPDPEVLVLAEVSGAEPTRTRLAQICVDEADLDRNSSHTSHTGRPHS
jgi:FlaA1/EpsC-like NDP-sugar epimerase